MIDPKLLEQVRYRCIGPTRGGRVVAVAGHPTDRNVHYFGGVAGGVWKTDDAGLYWECISDGQMATSSVGALAVAPSDPNVIYAGMGESTIRIDVTHGDGVYKTTDGGGTWTHCGLEATRHIGAVVVHPDDPDTVWVAALGHASVPNPERGVYKSTDGGATWDLILHVDDSAGAVDLSLDPTNPRILFATIWQARRTFWSMDSGGPHSGLWRSMDGGDTWTDLSEQPGMPDGPLGKIGVSISPARPERVWAMVEAGGRNRGLYRSDDRGESWTHLTAKPELAWRPWYYMHVIAHPTDPEQVFVMNMKAWRSIDGGATFGEFTTPHGDTHDLWIDPADPERMIGADDGGAFVSLNGGRSWSSIYNQLTAQFYHLAVDDQFPYLVYGSQQDNSSIAVPSRTYTGAISWADCYPPGTAESGYIAPKPGDPDIVFVGSIGSSPGAGDALQRYDHKTKQIQLVSVWPEAYHDGNSSEVRFQWTYPIVFSPHDPDVIYACGNKVFKTSNEGMAWDPISPDLTRADPDTMGVSGPLTMDTAGAEMYATIFSFIASAHRKGTLMAGSDDGLVHVSHDDGETWTDVTPGDLPPNSQVTMLEESPHRDGVVFMTVARHKMGDGAPYVYVTDDFGDTWRRIDDGLPDGEFCRVVREDPDREGLLYVGTEQGVHVSFDDGGSWQPLQSNLPVSPVYDLVVKHGDLVVATHGRSFWILDDVTQLHQLADASATETSLFAPCPTVRTPPHIFAGFWGSDAGKNYHVTLGQNATFELNVAETGHKTKRLLDAGTDIEPGVRFTYQLATVPDAPVTLTITGPDGAEVDTFTSDIPADKDDRVGLYLTATEGMNAFQWPMMHPDGVKVSGSEYHGRPKGPLALPGTYTATLTADGTEHSQTFELVMDPRVDVADGALQEQFDLLMEIQSTLSAIATAVNESRSIRTQLCAWMGRTDDEALSAEMATAADALLEVEGRLIQAELTSPGDSLNYREMLFEKLSGLEPVVSSADAAPTAQSHAVFAKLKAEIDTELAALADVRAGAVAEVNAKLTAAGVDIIGI